MLNSRLTTLSDGRVQILAPAKLNLGLRVFPPRADGFHPLETWMVATSWHDTLRFTPGTTAFRLRITGRSEGIPREIEKNLVGKAAIKLATAAGIPPTGTLELHKVVPPGGGLGGGSSDAAAALVALNHAWKPELSEQTLLEIAAQLGSDVPFFIAARPALCTGRGEIMSPLVPRNPMFAVLVIPPQGCPTKEVYEAFDALPPNAVPSTNWQQLAALTAEELNGVLVNNLAPAAYRVAPWLKALRDQAEEIAGQPVHMTGSGSTLFTLASAAVRADALRERFVAGLSTENAVIPIQISGH